MSNTARILVLVAALVLGLLVTAGVLTYRGCSALIENGDRGGVKLAADLPQYAQRIVAVRMLDEEKLVVFYDTTISLDGSEIYFVTNRRLVHVTDGRTQAIALDRIESIERKESGLEGVTLLVRAEGAEYMQVTIAHMNGVDIFEDVLRSEWKRRVPPPARR